jgi:hypothetical protein
MTADEFNQKEMAAGRLTPAMLAVAQEAGGIVAFQEAHGLDADGKAGMKTQAMLAAQLQASSVVATAAGNVEIPKGQAGVERVYGKFDYSELGGGRIALDPKWAADNICSVRLHTGKVVKLHKLVGAEFARLFEEACKASGYTPTSVQTFVPRHTLWNPEKSLSLHSWGIAIDFTPSENTMGGTDGKGGPSKLRQFPAFVEVFKKAGWTWGGDWKMKDDMHFQRAGS